MTQTAARAIRDHARDQARRAQRVLRANVTKLDPLTVVRLDNGQTLEVDDDFDLTGWMKLYTDKYSLVVGETVLLHREYGHYACFDVLTDKDITWPV